MSKPSVVKILVVPSAIGLTGSSISYFIGDTLCLSTFTEIIKSLASISAIASALVGWSVGWISQNKDALKDTDYRRALDMFDRLSILQNRLIWTWGLIFISSSIAVVGAILSRDLAIVLLYPSIFFLLIAYYFVVYLFRQMLVLSKLKTAIDQYEQQKNRMNRIRAEPKHEG